VAEDIADIGTPEAKACLFALSWADQGPFGALCEKLITDLGQIETPLWATRIGTTRLARAAADQRPGDGKVIVFDVQRRFSDPHSLCVYIDEIRGGIAKYLRLLHPFHELPMAGTPGADPSDDGMWFVPVDLRWACREVQTAVELTDETQDPPVDEWYAENRALTLARIAPYLLQSPQPEQVAA
jgi:hypothetical protein